MPKSNLSLPSYSIGSIERLKREAKAISRDTGALHSKALDQIAVREGYLNWSRLMLNERGPMVGAHRDLQSQEPKSEYPFQRTAAGMKDAMRSRRSSQEPTVADIEDLSVQFISAANAARYAVAYMEMALAAPRFKVSSYSWAYLEMRNHLPYRLHVAETDGQWILVNRHYKPVGSNRPEPHVRYDAQENLLFSISDADAEAVSDPRHVVSQGLYGDGSTPWISRTTATAYLSRLRKLLAVMDRDSRVYPPA